MSRCNGKLQAINPKCVELRLLARDFRHVPFANTGAQDYLRCIFVLWIWRATTRSANTVRRFCGESGRQNVDPFKSSDGRIVVLLFIRTDCPISNRYAPAIQKLVGLKIGWIIFDVVARQRLLQRHSRILQPGGDAAIARKKRWNNTSEL
jgi:hypothetical protein